MLANGYHDLEPGQLAALVTYLRHDLRILSGPAIWPPGAALHRIGPAEGERYLRLFRAVGADWLWFGRLQLSPAALTQLLSDPDYEIRLLAAEGEDLGLMELDFRSGREPELAYFGLKPGVIGRGLGRQLMAEALSRAKSRGVSHLMVHTCSLDAPGAVDFYRKSGFVPYRRAIEIFADPRLDGTLPPEAAAQVPLIG